MIYLYVINMIYIFDMINLISMIFLIDMILFFDRIRNFCIFLRIIVIMCMTFSGYRFISFCLLAWTEMVVWICGI